MNMFSLSSARLTRRSRTAMVTVGVMVLGTALIAQSAADAVKVRQAHMTLSAANFGVLAGMARGRMDYDAGAAQTAADNLAAITNLDQGGYWPEGSAMGEVDGTKALAAIWENPEEFAGHRSDLAAATIALAAVAGDGLEAMQAGVGPVGASCGACHESFQGR